MKKRVVAKAQKRTRRNIAKWNGKLQSLTLSRTKTREEQKAYKEAAKKDKASIKPNRKMRRIWKRIMGKNK